MNENRISKKRLILIIGIITSILIIVPAAIAITLINSPEVSVTVDAYTLTISDPADGTTNSTYIFSGVLNKNGVAQVGATVTLFKGGVSTELTAITDAAGGYSILWTPTVAGTFIFKTQYSAP